MSAQDNILMAKRHLGIPENDFTTKIPKCYTDELTRHLRLNPHDTHFRLKLQPKTGFGVVTCLEEGCNNAQVKLGPRVNPADGGKYEGLGSLSAYRIHVTSHSTHAKMRNARLKAASREIKKQSPPDSGFRLQTPSSPSPAFGRASRETKPRLVNDGNSDPFVSSYGAPDTKSTRTRYSLPQAPVKSEGVSGTAFTAGPSIQAGSQGRVVARPRWSLPQGSVKPEPVDPIVPRKRLSDSMLPSELRDYKTEDAPSTPPPKKAKLEEPKTPLAFQNMNAVALPTPSSSSTRYQGLHLTSIERRLAAANAKYLALRSGGTRTTAEIRRLGALRREIQILELQRRLAGSPAPPLAKTEQVGPRLPPVLPRMRMPWEEPMVASGSNVKLPPSSPIQRKTVDYFDSEANSDLPSSEAGFPMDVDDAHPPIPSLDVNAHLFAPNPLLRRDNEDLVDENGDFCGRGRDLFVGPQAAPGDIHRFLTVASAEQFDGNASVDTALAKLGLTANFQNLPGMEICLMPHQTIGVAWMLEKENGPLKGGMLADEMGLGKTVQMMATIVMNRSDDPACKTTLILAPTALLDQWKLEIETKTSCDLQCYIYHGARKLKTKAELMKYDVVLTTFSTMALEWPDIDAEQKAKMKRTKKKKVADSFIESDSDDILSRKPKPKKKKDLGLLFQVNWYRIVLDEAQNIRTKKTRSSRAVTELKATYRWCLTGTPIINSLSDTYPLIRFLRIRPWYDWKDFNTQVAIIEKKNPGLATSRLQAIMATFVMRRKKDSMLDGKRLIDLPPKEVALVKLEFSAEERTIYNMVEGKAQAQFNRFLRAGTVLKNYVEVLVMLLRLRQTCAHAALIQENGMHMAFIDADDMAEDHRPAEVLTELSRAKETVSAEFVAKMRDKFMQSALLRMQAEKESLDAKPGDDEECPICFDAFTDPIVTPCTHMFCRECLTGVLNNPHALDAAGPHYNHDQRPCPVCRSAVSAVNVFSRPIFEPTDAELDDAMKTEDSDVDMQNVAAVWKHDGARKGKAKARSRQTKRAPRIKSSDDVVDEEEEYSDDEDDEDDLSDFIVEDDEDEDYKDARRTAKRRVSTKRPVIIDSEDEMELEDQDIIFGAKRDDDISEEDPDKKRRFLPSTKMKAMMKSLETWAVENPGEKTIVISQWTECLKLASGYLVERNIPHVNYIGSMDRKKRDQAVKVFMHKDKARVMLMSLKCGGVGLNLTRANRVISLDLGWSEAIESQAHDRVHRLGQMRPVLVQRLVISNTVEDRILALQERKKNLADGSLGEGSGKKIGRLSVRELAALFGVSA